MFKADSVRKNEREITLHRWIARKATISRLVQIVLIQAIQIELRQENVLANLTTRCDLGMQLPELGYHRAVHNSSRRTPRMVTIRRLRVVVQRRVLERFEQILDIPLYVKEGKLP